MLQLLTEGLVIAGTCILIGALTIPVRRLLAELPSGSMRRRWYILASLIVLFVFGYLGYAILLWKHQATSRDIVVPAILFLGAGFVWLTATLSLQTVADVLRVTLLEYENVTDPLVGIYNRRYLDRRIKEEVTRAQRYALPLSVLLIDVDHFKRINDTHGHQVGDLVLRHLGELILQSIRQVDIAARYGGEEILIIATHTTVSLADALAERLRQQVETHDLKLTNGSDETRQIHITVSIGVAGLSEEATDSQRVVSNADKALYRAKQEGRNRVVVHDADSPEHTSAIVE